MKLTLKESDLKKYLEHQLENHFPDRMTKKAFKGKDIDRAMDMALFRLEKCFKPVSVKGYNDDNGNPLFSHLHSDQYAQFLYFFMNSLWNDSQNKPVCDKVMLLLRDLNGIFMTYKCQMPDIFLLNHAVGTVIGNADFSDYLVILQNVTINTGTDRPGTLKIGKGVTFCAGSKVIGDEEIGDRVNVGVDAVVYKTKIDSDKSVIRAYDGSIQIKDSNYCMAQRHFKDTIL